jgi:hypothetical protein
LKSSATRSPAAVATAKPVARPIAARPPQPKSELRLAPILIAFWCVAVALLAFALF